MPKWYKEFMKDNNQIFFFFLPKNVPPADTALVL